MASNFLRKKAQERAERIDKEYGADAYGGSNGRKERDVGSTNGTKDEKTSGGSNAAGSNASGSKASSFLQKKAAERAGAADKAHGADAYGGSKWRDTQKTTATQSNTSSTKRRMSDIVADREASRSRLETAYRDLEDVWSNYGASHDNILDKLAEQYGGVKDENGTYQFRDQKGMDDYNRVAGTLSGLYNTYFAEQEAYNRIGQEAENYRTSDKVKSEINALDAQKENLLKERFQLLNNPININGKRAGEIAKELNDIAEQLKPLEDEYEALKAEERQEMLDSGEYREANLWDLTWNSAKQGWNNAVYGKESYRAMMGEENEAEQYREMLEGEEYKFLPTNKFAEAVSGAFNLGGQMVNTATDPRAVAGGTGAAAAAALAGNAGPQALVPEEVLTVPSAYAFGMQAGTALSSFEMEAGFAYNEMLENGISEDTARKVALVVGGANAALEMLQVDELIDSYRILRSSGATQGAADTLWKKLVDMGIDKAFSVGKETMQEVGQEFTTLSGAQVASLLDKGELAYSGRDVAERLGDTAMSSALSFGMMTAPGAAINAAGITADHRATDKLGGYFTGLGDETVKELVETGLETGANTESHKLAAAIKEKMDAGETVTEQEIGRLYRENVSSQKREAELERANNPLMEAAREATSLDESGVSTEADNRPTPEAKTAEAAPVAESDPLLEAAREAVGAEPAKQSVPYNVMATNNPERQARMARAKSVQEITGYGEHGASSFANIVETTGEHPGKVQLEFQSAYEAGRVGLDQSVARLNNSVRLEAYNAGRLDAIMAMDTAKTKAQGAVIRKDAGFDQTNLPKDVTRAQAKAVDMLAKATGVRVRIAKGLKGNAEIAEDGTVLINETFEREVGGKKRSILFYAAHEIGMHRLMQLAPEEGQAFINAVIQDINSGLAYGQETAAERRQTAYAKQDVYLSTGKAMEEVSADSIYWLYDNEDALIAAIEKVFNGTDEKAKQGARKFKDILDDIVRKLKKAIAKLTGKEKAEARQVLTEVESLRDLFEKGLRAATERVKAEQNTGKATKNATQEGGGEVQYSTKQEVLALDGVDWMDDFSSIKAQLQKHADEINKLSPVAVVDYTPKSAARLVSAMMAEVAKIGGKNMKNGGVGFEFDEAGAKKIDVHAKTNELRAAALASPYVAKFGRLIAGQKNHENSGLTTLTYAAPVIINDTTVNVGVAIQFQANGRPRAVNVGLQSGGVFKIDIKKAPKGPDSRVSRYGQGTSLPTMSASNEKVAQPGKDVNTQHSLKDSEGNKLSKEQQDFFRDSKVRDKDGNLKVMYHGSGDAGFHVFNPRFSDDGISLFFTDSNTVAKGYSGTHEIYSAKTFQTTKEMNRFLAEIGQDEYEVVREGNKFVLYYDIEDEIATAETLGEIYDEFLSYSGLGQGSANYKVYLNIKNPLVVDARNNRWDELPDLDGNEAKYEYIKLVSFDPLSDLSTIEYAMSGDHTPVTETVNLYKKFDDGIADRLENLAPGESIKNIPVSPMTTREYSWHAKKNGYDGVIFNNIIDSGLYASGRERFTPTTVAIAFESNQIKSADNLNPTQDKDIRYSLKDQEMTDAINQSMTMVQAKDMVQRAFILGDIKRWYDGKYKNGDEWARGEGAADVAMIVDNEWSLQEKFLNKIQGVMDGDFYAEDIIEAYLAGTLTGQQKQNTTKRLDTSEQIGGIDDRFYAPKHIAQAQEAYEIASQKVTNKNRDAVYKARADIIMFAHTRGAAEALGITQPELNKKLSAWARYNARARETSQRFNEGVADWNKWTGIENSNILNKASVSNEDLDRLVGEITGDSDGWQRKYIMRTMLALDTHIDYTGLNFRFVGQPDPNNRNVNGLYSNGERTITVKHNAPHTVAHEMGHYLDYQWARDVGVGGALTDRRGRNSITDPAVKQWVTNFDNFKESLEDAAVLHSGYTMDSKEVFARFVDRFVLWVNFTANGEQDSSLRYNDKFTAKHYIEFVRLLQEKSVLDGKKQQGAQFSLKEQEDLLAENAKLKEVNQALREQFNTTKFAKVDKKALRDFTKKLLKDYSSGADIDETRDALDDLYTYLANGEDGMVPGWNDAYRRAYDVAVSVLENATVLDDEMWRQYKDLRDRMRTRGVSISKEYSHDLGAYENLQDFRRRNAGRIRVANDAMPVDVVYQELANTYPELFDVGEHSTVPDQLVHIADVLEEMKPIEINPYRNDMREAATWLANDIMERFFELPQAKPTFADKADRRLTDQVIKDTKKLEKLRAEKNEKIAKIIEENREKVQKAVTGERMAGARELQKLKQKYAAKEAKASESKKAGILRAKILRHTGNLKRDLFANSDKHHIPHDMRLAVEMLLDSINMESQYEYVYGKDGKYHRVEAGTEMGAEPTKRTEAFRELRKVYKTMMETDASDVVIDPDIMDVLERVIDLSDIPISAMNSTQLDSVWQAVRIIEHACRTAGKMLSRAKYERTVEWADAIVHDTRTRKDMKGKFSEKLRIDLENPYTFFSHYGEAGKAIFRMLRDAQDAQQMMVEQVAAEVKKIVAPKTVRKWEREVHAFTTERGDKLTLTSAQCMEIHELLKREQARDHLMKGGIVQPEVKHKKIKRGTDAILLTPADLMNIVQVLTDEQVKVADALQRLTCTTLADFGNEASMKAYGYKKFTGTDYWPIKSAKEAIHSNVEKGGNNTRSIKNIGLAKSVIPHASNPLDIGGVFKTFASHAGDMTDYAAWLCPMEDANRLYNFQFRNEMGQQTGRTMKGLLDRVGGRGAQDYWSNLMEDIQNGIKPQNDTSIAGLISKIYGNTKGASVAWNIRVIVQQPTAIIRAAMVLSAADMVKGVASGGGWKKALEWSAIAKRKAMGGFDISSPMQMGEVLFDSKDGLQRFNEVGMLGAAKADELTWGRIWNACEWNVKRKQPGLKGNAFYEAVTEVFEEVIDQSQVVDGVLQRSQAMRSGNAWMNMATAFMGEPTMALNMLLRAYDAFTNETNPKKRGKAIKTFGRATTVLLLTNVVNALAQSLVDAARDDEDEEYWEKFLTAFTGVTGEEESGKESAANAVLEGNLVGGINPVGYIPFLKDLLSIMSGYSVQRADAAVMEDVYQAGTAFCDSWFGDGKKERGNATLNLFKQVSKVFGIGVGNLTRDVYAALRTAALETGNIPAQYELEKWIYKLDNEGNTGRFVDILFKAYETDKDVYEHIYNDLISVGIDAADIKSKMESRMKKEQGVKKVEELDQRYLNPDLQPKWDSAMSDISGHSLWKNADENERDALEAKLYDLVTESKDSEEMRDKIREGASYGVDETEYLLYTLALDMYDQPNKSGEYGGTPTAREKADAIIGVFAGESESAYLWGLGTTSDEVFDALDAGVDIYTYMEFKAGLSELEAGVDYKKGDTRARKDAVNALLRSLGLDSGDSDYKWLYHTEYKK